jgi:ribosomal protein L7/L12
MNNKIICEKCGAEMLPIDPNKPVGMTCPNCGWGWATTYIDPEQEDDTVYVISLSKGNIATIAAVKAISKITNKNFVQAKKIIENSPVDIYSGNAVQVKDVLLLLESLSMAYCITPEFPYSLNQEEANTED